jgi:hypothetical protein
VSGSQVDFERFLRRLKHVSKTAKQQIFFAACPWATAQLASPACHLKDQPLQAQSCQLHAVFREGLFQREKDSRNEPETNQSDAQMASNKRNRLP